MHYMNYEILKKNKFNLKITHTRKSHYWKMLTDRGLKTSHHSIYLQVCPCGSELKVTSSEWQKEVFSFILQYYVTCQKPGLTVL